jgi:hypothetical protein
VRTKDNDFWTPEISTIPREDALVVVNQNDPMTPGSII